MGDKFNFNGKWIGEGCPFYVIAEIGINHGGDLKTALALVDAAAGAGADAVKFQTYRTEKRTAKDSPIFDILKKCELPFAAFKEIKDFAESRKVCFFSTPFDSESLAYLESIQCPMYKVASFDITHSALLKQVSGAKKPVFLSVGMSNTKEIDEAYEMLKQETDRIVLLHCITAYPTKEEDANLNAIMTMRRRYDCVIGQSDHTAGIRVPLYAAAAGARVLEKHFKISRDMDCADAPVSIDRDQMAEMVRELRRLESILGCGKLEMRKVEEQFQWLRRY